MSERLKTVGDYVSDWAAHPLDAIIMCLLPGIAAAVALGIFVPILAWQLAALVGFAVSVALFGIYCALRRGGYLEEDVPLSYSSLGPYTVTTRKLVLVFVASRIAMQRINFSFDVVLSECRRLATACGDDERPLFCLTRSVDDSDEDGIDDAALRRELELFVQAGWLDLAADLYAVTPKGERQIMIEVQAAVQTDPYTISELAEEFGLPLATIKPFSDAT